MLGSVGKGWSTEASKCTIEERLRQIRQRCVTKTINLILWSKVSQSEELPRLQTLD